MERRNAEIRELKGQKDHVLELDGIRFTCNHENDEMTLTLHQGMGDESSNTVTESEADDIVEFLAKWAKGWDYNEGS